MSEVNPAQAAGTPAAVNPAHTPTAPAPTAPPANIGGWANPAPAGLVALAVATFGFWAVLTEHVKPTAAPYLGVWLIGGFFIQFTVAVIELREGAMPGGNIFLYFSAYFMLASGLKFLLTGNLIPATVDRSIDGWIWMCLLIATWGFTPAYLKRGPATLTTALILLDVALPFIMAVDLGWMNKNLGNPIAAWFLLASGLVALYTAIAMITNNAFGRTVMPFPGPFLK